YETLWGFCGKTAEGNGGEGPPDGWCYEGRHTADTKSARFSAETHDNKLTSCLKLHCCGIRDMFPPGGEHHSSPTRKSKVSPARSHAVRSVIQKRAHKSTDKDTLSASEDERDRNRGRSRKSEDVDNLGMMFRDLPPKVKPRPVSRVRPSNSTSMTAFLPLLPSKPISMSNKPPKCAETNVNVTSALVTET
ncbi:hypothetical protein EDD16DRAFT_1482335, partial [Pisolithus croceorrhizus]